MRSLTNTKNIAAEAMVIIASFIGIYLYVSVFTFTNDDLVDGATISNYGGELGSNLAYFFLFFFGRSSYLIIATFIYAIWTYAKLFSSEESAWLTFLSSLIGLTLLLISTCGLEAMRLYSLDSSSQEFYQQSVGGESLSMFANNTALPANSGNVLGIRFSKSLYSVLGFHGSTLIMIGLWFASLSLFALFSWSRTCEIIGHWIEKNLLPHLVLAYNYLLKLLEKEDSDDSLDLDDESVVKKPRKAARKTPLFEKEKKVTKTVTKAEPTLSITPQAEPIVPKEAPAATVASVSSESVREHSAPPMDLLAASMTNVNAMSDEELHELASTIELKLNEFGVKAKVVEILPGPVITRFEILPDTGVKGSQIINLLRDLSRALTVSNIRVLETIAGKSTMGLEVPNAERNTVTLQDVIGSPTYIASKSPLTLALGKDIAGEPFVADLASMPHLLVAGTTGAGKSVQINSMILSILYKSSPAEVRMILIDPKVVELAPFDDLPHLLAKVISDMNVVPAVLTWCVAEMERRYQLMARLGVRNLASLNVAIDGGATDPEAEEPLVKLPQLVIVVDELADLMAVAGKKVEQLISRLAQKARAAGIHLILATQRPSVDVITGLIKANVPSRIAFQVSSRIDSRTILDQGGAETLLGKGDMLFLPTGLPEAVRVHGAFVSDEEVRDVTNHIRKSNPPTEKIDFSMQMPSRGDIGNGNSSDRDELYEQAVEIIMNNNRCSISLVQRHLRIGYNRAARIIEDMERAGLITATDSSGNRKIVTPQVSIDKLN